MSEVKDDPGGNNTRRLFFILSTTILVMLFFLLVVDTDGLASNKKTGEANDTDILEIKALVASVKDNQESPAKDYFYKVVNDSLKDGKIQHYEYEDIMQAYSEVNKLEAIF